MLSLWGDPTLWPVRLRCFAGVARVTIHYSLCCAAMVEDLSDPTQVSNEFMLRPPQDSQTFSHPKAAKDAQYRSQHGSHDGCCQESCGIGQVVALNEAQRQGCQPDRKTCQADGQTAEQQQGRYQHSLAAFLYVGGKQLSLQFCKS